MSELKLIYFEGCPNAKAARSILESTGVAFDVLVQDELSADSPYKNYSSPTILHGKKLITGYQLQDESSACSVEKLDPQAIKTKILGETPHSSAKGMFASFGSWGSAMTVGLCPVCIPAIGAFLSSIGLGFLVEESVLKPLLFIFIGISLFGFLWSYLKEHRNPYPLILGSLMALALYLGRYVYFNYTLNLVLMYGGIAGIIAVSVWNWQLRKKMNCSVCETTS